MPSIRASVLAVATVLASVARADYYVNPDSVSLSIRTSWCQSELSTCPIICQQYPPGNTEVNTCDPKTLTYGCICGNGQKPNISEYSLTLPYFTCTEWGNQCVKACGGDNHCQSACREDNPCGALHPTKLNQTATSSSAGPSATASDQVFSGLDGSTSTPGNSGAATVRMFESGSSVIFAVFLGGVALGAGLL